MSKKISWVITDHNITVNFDGQTHIVSKTGKAYPELIKALKENRIEDLPNLVSIPKKIEQFSEGNIVVRDGQLYVNGQLSSEFLGKKILEFVNEKLPYQPLLRFAEKLQENPSHRSVNELYSFMEACSTCLMDDGDFIAYKAVRSDFKDKYTGTFDNSVGNIVEMPRNQVNEDSNVTCSNGLHAASFVYAHDIYGSSGDIMLELKINPRDVVAVPSDYSNQKMRVCRYEVLGVVDKDNSTNQGLRVSSEKVDSKESEESEDEGNEYDEDNEDCCCDIDVPCGNCDCCLNKIEDNLYSDICDCDCHRT